MIHSPQVSPVTVYFLQGFLHSTSKNCQSLKENIMVNYSGNMQRVFY